MMYAGSEKEQASIITEQFKNIFTAVTVADEPTIIKPAEMRTPFTPEEIEKASKRMKNQKSVGEDGQHAEYVKYGPPEIYNGIATLLNTIARTGKYPAEIKSGILTPLPKPGKKQGPPANLRPIILLSIIRKILAICLIRRCWDRLHGCHSHNPLISLDEAQLNRCLPSKYSLKRPLHPARTISTYCY